MERHTREPGAIARTEQPDLADAILPPALWTLLVLSCLLFLIFPLDTLLRAHPTPDRLVVALAGMTTFVSIYLWLMLHEPFGAVPPPSAVRRQVPLLVVIVTIVLFLTLAYGVDWVWFVLYANSVAGMKLPARIAVVTIPALTLVTLGVAIATLGWQAIDSAFSTVVSVSILMIGISWMLTTIYELRAARLEIARLAVAEERLRFARDVHDLLGHSLSTIAIKTSLARRLLPGDPARAMHELDDVQTVTQEALREVREAVTGYRQPVLGTELDNAREVLAAAGIACRCEEVAGALPPAVESVLAWTVREGVTNVVRHSRARHVTIRLQVADGSMHADIIDDGDGDAHASLPTSRNGSGSGLRGLAERAAAIGGSVEAGPSPAGGFALRVTLPLGDRGGRATPVAVTESVR